MCIFGKDYREWILRKVYGLEKVYRGKRWYWSGWLGRILVVLYWVIYGGGCKCMWKLLVIGKNRCNGGNFWGIYILIFIGVF